MTKKLFHSDPYQTTAQATVESIQDNTVVLDQSIFFAFSGGQESDEGTIGGIAVETATDTSTKDNPDVIEYELASKPPFSVGDTVTVVIDEKRRNNIMRLHSAVHLVYYFVIEELGELEIIGSHISAEKGRIDFETETNLNEIRQTIQNQLQDYIQEAHEIQTVPDEQDPHIRWWKCEDYTMMCAGTHVQNTKEIAQVKLKRKNLGSGKERIEITLADPTTQ